eukprot:CAMPEP_0172575604 /NCGR_PEP_ID=MMETSP1067-20121228/137296_1 /TAXON_ID=265564 ORGANISM="Thalassiosira punctigera, Strain Tpunct2005C2" /NCGR_SAMPLE_ID=MMETSP1067 /ASSEMBLY_ACC=CAM_ASM_000444 /LENGTH=674 /DNA_ID=CAMNT_0013368255 /DNA_START=325 /DNA_END=2349 /DNA_ORIENTATION=-
MHQQPVLLRRTGSSLPSSTAPGSGGAVDPNASIPIADEDPGLSHSGRDSSHKRKQSGIPLDAEDIIHRASAHTSLEQIVDEEEGSDWGESDSGPGGEQQGGTHGSSMPEFNELFPDDQGGWLSSSLKSMLTSRGVAGMTLIMMALTFALLRPASTERGGGPDAAGGGAAKPNGRPQVDSKEITFGEEHSEIVGAPMEHYVHEYNKIRFFDSPDKMKPIFSKGPILWDEEMGGLHMFENVCLTNNVDALRYRPDPDTGLRGLIYFTPQESVTSNPRRCVPCSNSQPMENWEDANKDRKVVGHKCGMKGLHAMFASSVGDWSDCIMEEENAKLMEEWGQTQSPVNVSTIHFFQEPTFVLQFDAWDMERSLFDMLMTYLPHWDKFLGGANDEDDGFPFNSVISHSLQGCLSHSHNWFCEVLHQMYAFGEAKEIPWEGDENTLYCYRELYYNQMGYQRNLDHEGLVTREVFGEFREMLFRKFGLPRRRTAEDRLAELEYERAQGKKKNEGKDDGADDEQDENDGPKIIFYDNKLSEQTVWNQMESLISKARELEKYQNVKFVTVKDFDELTVAQQARKFNEADAIIMAHGPHMANAIFAVDGTSFVEVGCRVESLVGNPRFMKLMDGEYRAVEKCSDDGGEDGNVCVVCKGKGDDVNFTMTPKAFERLIDDVVARLQA